MKIDKIHVRDFIGAAAVDLAGLGPTTLICGPNGAGKSSVRDAVALALTGDLSRVSLKKDAPELIREGQEAAVCEVIDVDGDPYRATITRSGKVTSNRKGQDGNPVLRFVLDAQAFARLKDTERRAFLFDLMAIKTDTAAIRSRLNAYQADGPRFDRVAPLLRSGFDAAADEAKEHAKRAKGAWHAVTGEHYGSEKAKDWKATVPAYDAAAAAEVARQVQHADIAIGQWQQQVGALQAEEKRRQELQAKLPALREHAERIPRLQAKLDTDTAGLAEQDAALRACEAAAGGAPRVGLVHDLAAGLRYALAFVPPGITEAPRVAADAALSAYEREHGAIGTAGVGEPAALARLPEVKAGRDIMARAVENDRRDLAAAQQAKAVLDEITAELAEVFDAAALADARAQIADLQEKRAAAVKRGDELRSIKALVDAADAKTAQAAQHALDVAGWEALADALGPNGIPADLLAEALAPLNDRLAQSASDAQWPRVEVTADMQIRTGLHERDYRLLSESERWRCDAMLAEAIAQLSGVRLLVLDRFDVLDLPGRVDLLAWLDVLAENGELDTALVFGTLKAIPPAGSLPASVAAHWIDGGTLGQLAAAA